MKKIAGKVIKGDKIKIGEEVCVVINVEASEIGKQGTKKIRIEAQKKNGEKIIFIRPEDYPLECL